MKPTTDTLRAKRVLVLVFGLLVPTFLVALGAPRLLEGVGLERARAAYDAAVDEQPLATASYQSAADALASVLADDGDGLVQRSEMMALAANGRPAELRKARAIVVAGLLRAPVNPRGWTLLCQIDVNIASSDATRCMDTAFFIAPFDWFVARKRALLAAHLWPQLDPDVREAAARRVRLMWESDEWPDHRVRQSLYEVYRSPNGPTLLTAGFRSDKDELRAVNRWLVQQQMYGPPK